VPAHHRRAQKQVNYTRRRVLVVGAATGVAVGVSTVIRPLESAAHFADGLYNEWAGNCQSLSGELGCTPHGTNVSGSFISRFRRRRVNYTVGYPDGHGPGSRLPLVFMLHGFGGANGSVGGYSPAQAASMSTGLTGGRPLAIVTMDGGQGYWHPHPADDPMGMIVHEMIPMLRRWGLGRGPDAIGAMGISMGGYGAIALAENYPTLFRAVAAISPAIFVSYEHVHYVNPGAYVNAADFARYDAVTHTSSLAATPLRVASGDHDPFHPWVEDFQRALPTHSPATFLYPPGGHDEDFFGPQVSPSVAFLAERLEP